MNILKIFDVAVNHQIAGRVRESMDAYVSILKEKPTHLDALNNLAILYTETQRLSEARECYEKILTYRPDLPDIQFKMGVIYSRLNQPSMAANCYQTAIHYKNNFPDAYFNLGLALGQLKKTDKAILCFQKVIEFEPENTNAWFNLGNNQMASGQLEDAVESYRHILTIDPENANAMINIDIAIQRLRPVEKSLLTYQQVVQALPDIAELHFNLGLRYIETSHIESAEPCFSKTLEKGPDFIHRGPKRIRIEISSACNLRCQHCPTGVSYNDIPRSMMSTNVIDALLPQMKSIPGLLEGILYLAGEPLLNKNFPSICRRIRNETNITYIQFNTNGMLINETLCRELADIGINHIGISIDGRTPDENDHIRVGSRYSIIKKNIRTLRQYLKNTLISIDNTVIKKQGDPDIPEISDFLKRDFPDMPIETHYAMNWPGLINAQSDSDQFTTTKHPAKSFCKMPFNQISVRTDGTVLMCCYDLLGEYPMGNILESDLITIWRSDEYQTVRRNMLEFNTEKIPAVCQNCNVYTGLLLLDRKIA